MTTPRPTVLLVDDAPHSLSATRRTLENAFDCNTADAETALAAFRALSDGERACIIRRAKEGQANRGTQRTAFGVARIVDMLVGDQLPRICQASPCSFSKYSRGVWGAKRPQHRGGGEARRRDRRLAQALLFATVPFCEKVKVR